jgi:hypothetical protein
MSGSTHPGYLPKLMCYGFEERFDARTRRNFQTRLCADSLCHSASQRGACGQVHIQAAGEESFQNPEVGGREFGECGDRQDDREVRSGNRRERIEGCRCEGERTRFAPVRRLNFAVSDYESSGNHISEPLIEAAKEHYNDAYRVEAGQIVNEADQVAGQGFDKTDSTAGTMDHVNLCHALSGCPSVGERLK